LKRVSSSPSWTWNTVSIKLENLKQQFTKEKREATGEWGCFCTEDPSRSPGVRAEPLQG